MILLVAARPQELASERVAGVRAALEPAETELALLEAPELAELLERARIVCLFDARGAHAELARVTALAAHRAALVWFPGAQTFHQADRAAIYRRVAERADRIVYPSQTERDAGEAVLGAFAGKTSLDVDGAAIRELRGREPLVCPPLGRVLLWSHRVGLGDSVNLLAVASALADAGADVTWVAPDRHLPVLEGQLPAVTLRGDAGFDPRAGAFDLVLEITIRGSDGWAGDVIDERWVQLTLDWQSVQATMHENLLAFLARAGVAPPPRRPQLATTEAAREIARTAFAAANVTPSEHLVLGIHPGAGNARKHWAPERFAEVIERVRRRHVVRVVVVGGPGEEPLVDAIAARTTIEIASRAAPLPEVAALLAGCTAVLSNDSGLMHIASALDVPTLGIYGPSSSRVWAPAHPWRAVVVPPRPTPRSLDAITVDEVERALEEFLARIAAEPPSHDVLVVTQPGLVRTGDAWEAPAGASVTAAEVVDAVVEDCRIARRWSELETRHDRALLEALLAAGLIAPVWWRP